MSLSSIPRLLILLAVTAVSGVHPLFARTEVSGEVSGVWNPDGSPYIVVDTTWIPAVDTLRIDAGIAVRFGGGLGLEVRGRLEANGSEEDSIRFLPRVEDEPWLNICTGSDSARIELNYCHIEGITGYAVGNVFEETSLSIRNSTIIGDQGAVGSRLSDVCLSNCRLIAQAPGGHTLYVSGARLTAENCEIDGIRNEAGGYEEAVFVSSRGSCILTGSRVRGDVFNYDVIETRAVDCELAGISAEGFGEIDHCVIQGILRVEQGDDFIINDCDIRADLSLYCYSGSVTHSDVSGNRVCLRGVTFHDSTFISDCDFDVYDFELVQGGYVSIDSCFIAGNISARDAVRLDMSRCVILKSLDIGVGNQFTFANNTVFVDDLRFRTGQAIDMLYADNYRNYSLRNNIIYIPECGPKIYLFYFNYRDDQVYPDVRYNCIIGYDQVLYNHLDRRYIFDLDSTNILCDPRFVSTDSLDLSIIETSPCIDAGDPDSPLDPDGSRADIGAYYFDQLTVHDQPRDPVNFTQLNVYPNPFNSSATIYYAVPYPSQVSVKLTDVSGREVISVTDKFLEAGKYRNVITGEDLVSGVYFVKFQTQAAIACRKVIILK